MQFRVFSIPAFGDAEGENDLNAFLRSHRVVSVRREVVQIEGTSYWSFCIEYVEGGSGALRNGAGKRGESRARVDYQQVLSPPDFALFLQLRDVRKELAAREGVPVYAVCTNEQLAAMSKGRSSTVAELKKIEGLGDAKAEKYGAALLEVIAKALPQQPEQEQQDASSGTSD